MTFLSFLVSALIAQSTITYVAIQTPTIYAATIEHVVPSAIEDIVRGAASTHHVSGDLLMDIVSCEDPTLDPTIQSFVVDRHGPNGRENSWGIAQIDLDYHRDVTRSEAQDPAIAAEFLAAHVAAGEAWLWSCYNRSTSSGR